MLRTRLSRLTPSISLSACLGNNNTPAFNGAFPFFLAYSSTRVRSSAPSGPWPAGFWRGQRPTLSQSPAWQTGSRNNSIAMNVNKSIPDCTEPWLDTSPNCWPLDEHHYTEVFAVCSSFQTNDFPLWSDLLTPTAHAAALREKQGHCLNCHEDTHSLQQCRHLFINASGCLNPDLGQPGDNREAYRRWQARMLRFRREDKPSRSSNQKKQKNNRRRRGHLHGQHQSQRQQNKHNDGYNTHKTRQPAVWVWSPPGSPALARRFRCCHLLWHPLRCHPQPRQKPERVPARHLLHW